MKEVEGRKWLIVILGATGVGKTDLSIKLAEKFNTVIISADSRQCYKELNKGTAKPTQEIRERIKHYGIDTYSIHEKYNPKIFEQYALEVLKKLFTEKQCVIVVGGSGLYIRSLCEGLDYIPTVNKTLREKWNQLYKSKGIEYLREQLTQRDKLAYERIDKNNPRRLLRALEVCEATEKPYSTFLTEQKAVRKFTTLKIGLDLPKAEHRKLINTRVDQMIQEGLLEEAKQLYTYRNLVALQTIGYRECFAYLDQQRTWLETIEQIKQNTYLYAKRQRTWFRKDESIVWFNSVEKKTVVEYLEKKIKNGS